MQENKVWIDHSLYLCIKTTQTVFTWQSNSFPDFVMTLKVADQSSPGLYVNFFAEDTGKLPNVQSNGDIICLRRVVVVSMTIMYAFHLFNSQKRFYFYILLLCVLSFLWNIFLVYYCNVVIFKLITLVSLLKWKLKYFVDYLYWSYFHLCSFLVGIHMLIAARSTLKKF